MTKVKGDVWKDPMIEWIFYCPFCGKDVSEVATNVWIAITDHLSLKHLKDLDIRKKVGDGIERIR